MGRTSKQRERWSRYLGTILLGIIVLGIGWHIISPAAFGAQLGSRSLQLSSDEISLASQYKLSFSINTAGQLGSILIQFCSNDPLLADACTPPAGLDDRNAALTAQSGETGFSIVANPTANVLTLTRPVSSATTGPVSYTFSNIVNPSSSGSYYVRLQTFNNQTATGTSSDYGGIAFSIVNELTIQADVPPYLIFCTGVTIPELNCASATGDYIDFGELSQARTDHGSSQMLAATNAQNGYGITMTGTTLESGTDSITALANDDVSRPGTAQFGLIWSLILRPPAVIIQVDQESLCQQPIMIGRTFIGLRTATR